MTVDLWEVLKFCIAAIMVGFTMLLVVGTLFAVYVIVSGMIDTIKHDHTKGDE